MEAREYMARARETGLVVSIRPNTENEIELTSSFLATTEVYTSLADLGLVAVLDDL